jgi:hypothetical protein
LNIQKNQVDFFPTLFVNLNSVIAVESEPRGMTFILGEHLQRAANQPVVVDNQNANAPGGGRLARLIGSLGMSLRQGQDVLAERTVNGTENGLEHDFLRYD